MIQRLWRFLLGYVVLKIRGPKLERFLNRAAKEGIAIWDAERLGQTMLVVRVSLAGFRRARRLCRAQGWRVSIAEKVGLPFLGVRLLRRKMLVAGGLLALAAIYWASGYIWFVAIETEEGAPVEKILQVAEEAGLRPGVSRRSIDRYQIQRALLLEIDELSWATVQIQGDACRHRGQLAGGSSTFDDPARRPGGGARRHRRASRRVKRPRAGPCGRYGEKGRSPHHRFHSPWGSRP